MYMIISLFNLLCVHNNCKIGLFDQKHRTYYAWKLWYVASATDLEAFKGSFVMIWMHNPLLDDIPQMFSIGTHEIDSYRRWRTDLSTTIAAMAKLIRRILPGCSVANLFHFTWPQPPSPCEELEPISSVWQVWCSHLQPSGLTGQNQKTNK